MVTTVSILDGSRTINEGEGRAQITLVTDNPVPAGELLLVDIEIVPGTATPLQDYEYRSPGAVFIRQTGVYADRISIPSGASIGSVLVDILPDEIIEGSENFTINITGVSPSAQIGENSSISITILDDDGLDDGLTVLYRVNAGGPEVVATDGGPNWLPDETFLVNPEETDVANTSAAVTLGDTVPNTTPPEIFQTERFDAICGPKGTEMAYAFAVDPGIYEVRLYVANTFEDTRLPDQRIFDVAIENQILPSLNNIDPSAKFGHLTGGLLSNQVKVTDGTLNLVFLHDSLDGVENPLINGIEIIKIGDIPPTVALVGEPYIVNENDVFTKVSLVTSEPVPADENVTITFEIVPDTAKPLEDYKYESVTATFDPTTGIYTDTATIPSGFSVSGILVNILQDNLPEDSEAFTVNVTSVDSYFQIGEPSSLSVTIEDSSSRPTALRIEAEDTLYSAYQLENVSLASGGRALRVDGDDLHEGSVSTIAFKDITGFEPGVYDIVVGTFDQFFSGGQVGTAFKVELNGTILKGIQLNELAAEESVNLGASVAQVAATGIQLDVGDTLAVIGTPYPSQPVWLDYIQLNPIAPSELVL